MDFSLKEIVDGSIGPFDQYCDGYGNYGTNGIGYISALTLSTGKVLKKLDHVLEGIVSYDRAEANDAYIGQINMIAASSFCGLNGAVWGYHLSKSEDIANQTLKPLMIKKRHDGADFPVYPVRPLLNAAEGLFGTNENRRFPLLPGAHVICATKECTVPGPTSVWSAIALAIAEDRRQNSNLFIEDVGHSIPADSEEERTAYLEQLMENVVDSVLLCGEDQNVKYKEMFVGFKTEWVPEGYVGCALVCAPYIVLAKNAVPTGKPPSSMLEMTLSDWEKLVTK